MFGNTRKTTGYTDSRIEKLHFGITVKAEEAYHVNPRLFEDFMVP